MNYVAKYLGAVLFTLALMACGGKAVAAESQAGSAASSADPTVWGIYASLVDTDWSGAGGNANWRWGPDNTIVESRSYMLKTVIRPGATPGELVSVYGGILHTYDGRISPDGSILWIRRGRFLKMPSRVSIVDGRFKEEMVKLDEANQVARVSATSEFVQTDGLSVGVSAAVAGSTAAPGSEAPTVAGASSSTASFVPQPAVATAASVIPPAALTPWVKPSFGLMDTFIGQALVGEAGNLIVTTSDDGRVLNLSGSRDNFSFRHSATPGQLTVLVHPDYTGATASLNANGELVVLTKGSFLNGSHQRITYSATGEGGISRYSESKPRALLSGLLSWEYDSQYSFRPNSEDNVRRAAAEKSYSAQQAAENRQAELESKAALDQSFNRMMGDLSDHAARETQIRAEADEMVAQVNAQAEAIRLARIQEQQQAEARTAEERQLQMAEDARRAAENEQAATRYQAQVAERAAQPHSQERETTAGQSAAPAAGKQLRFVMSISLRNQPGDKVNPTCYSNIVSRPGPPGWGAPGFLPPGSGEQARESVYSLKSAFIAQCRASGREITSDGNFNFQMNQSQGDEQRLQEMRARYSEDVSVSL